VKPLFLIVFVTISVSTTFSTSLAADLKEGFMEYRWKETISEYPQLREIRRQGDISYYRNPSKTYTIDEIVINDVVYGFYNNMLFAVYIGLDTLGKYDTIKRYLQSKYGLPGTKVSTQEYLKTYHWRYEDITIKLKSHQIDTKMKLAFYYRPLSRELRQEQLEEITESTFKFFPIDKNKQPERIPFLEF